MELVSGVTIHRRQGCVNRKYLLQHFMLARVARKVLQSNWSHKHGSAALTARVS